MAIKVSHSTHYISPPNELSTRLENLAATAAFAQILGETSLFNQAKDAYHKLGNEWYEKARSEADKKSYKNWLGGGETYIVHTPLRWDSEFESGKLIIESQIRGLSRQHQQIALSYLVNNLSEWSAYTKCFERFKNLY